MWATILEYEREIATGVRILFSQNLRFESTWKWFKNVSENVSCENIKTQERERFIQDIYEKVNVSVTSQNLAEKVIVYAKIIEFSFKDDWHLQVATMKTDCNCTVSTLISRAVRYRYI